MNIKWLVPILAFPLLCGCQNPHPPEQLPEVTVPAIFSDIPLDRTDHTDLPSLEEAVTDDGFPYIRAGVSDVSQITCLGGRLLLFSGTGPTRLTLTDIAKQETTVQITLDCEISPNDPDVTVWDGGIIYPDPKTGELVALDAWLQETGRYPIPEGLTGGIRYEPSKNLFYYCTPVGLWTWDPETGTEQLLSRMTFQNQTVAALHYQNSVVECVATNSDGTRSRLFFDARTGTYLEEASASVTVYSGGDFYLAICPDGDYRELVTGSVHLGQSVLVPSDPDAVPMPLPELGGAVFLRDGHTLDFYDLAFGQRQSQLILPTCFSLKDICATPTMSELWLLCTDTLSRQDILCRWDLEEGETGDTAYYLQPRYDADNPDTAGLSQCAELAERLSRKHDIEILIWEDAIATQPWDYTLEAEYQVPLIRDRLNKLDRILERYPAGFLSEATLSTGGKLKICLVRSIRGNRVSGTLEDPVGLQFWSEDAQAFLAVTPGTDMEQHIYHELFHIIDTRVQTQCKAYDNWDTLNPKDFSYDYDYAKNLLREDSALNTGESPCFIDLYAMSFPKEDRARIMEYAMLPNQSHRFDSPPLQAKLHRLCVGIRQAFALDETCVILPWEQYLHTPLNP